MSLSDFITLRRSGCLGTCPIYSVTVHADGRVEVDGEHYVVHPGTLSWQIHPAVATRLLAEFVRADVFSLDPSFAGVTDLPSATLEGKLAGREFVVRHYGGGEEVAMGYSDPALLAATRLELLIDLTSEAESRVVGCTMPPAKRDEPGPKWTPGKKMRP